MRALTQFVQGKIRSHFTLRLEQATHASMRWFFPDAGVEVDMVVIHGPLILIDAVSHRIDLALCCCVESVGNEHWGAEYGRRHSGFSSVRSRAIRISETRQPSTNP